MLTARLRWPGWKSFPRIMEEIYTGSIRILKRAPWTPVKKHHKKLGFLHTIVVTILRVTLKGLQIVFTTDLKYIEDDIVHRDDTRAPELLPIVLPGQRSCSSITSLYCPVKNDNNLNALAYEQTHEIKIDACLLETYICAKMHFFSLVTYLRIWSKWPRNQKFVGTMFVDRPLLWALAEYRARRTCFTRRRQLKPVQDRENTARGE